jgi:hypothetical protein
MKLELKKFDISSIKDDAVIVFIGKRRTGKSFLVRDLLYYHTDIPIGTVVSATEGANRFFRDFVPYSCIYDEVTPELTSNIIKRQKKKSKSMKKEYSTYGTTRIDPRTFVIFDDCLYDSSWSKDKNVKALFMNGRHLKTLFIITMQYPLGIPPNLRTNVDYVFILRENITQNRRRIYENYAGIFPTYEIFSQIMDQCTENYECLVIDNTTLSNKVEECVFWYKGETHEDYKLCASHLWLNNVSDDDEDDSDLEDFDADKFKYKSNSKKIHVYKG